MPQNSQRVFKVLIPVIVILSLILLAALLVYLYLSNYSPRDANLLGSRATSTLSFVIIVTRHGNRAPLFTYSTYPYPTNDTAFWPYGPSQLTAKGRAQLYRLGEKIRAMYNTFLNDNYYPVEFQASSTAKDRTLMSAQAFLAGLYPPKGFQLWNEQLPWQPVPVFIHTVDHTEYVGEDVSKICPIFKGELSKVLSMFRQENDANLTSLFKYTQSHTGLAKEEIVHVLWDSLICADKEGFPLPSWVNKIYPEPLTSLVNKLESAMTSGSYKMKVLLQGELFREIVRLMEAKAKGSLTPDRKMYLYSGHDITIRTLRAILGNSSGMVHTGSALVLELHKVPTSKEHFIEVLYIDGASTDLQPSTVPIPDCGPPCPLKVFLNITKNYNNFDHHVECQVMNGN